MQHDGYDAHVRQVLVVHEQFSALGAHHVAPYAPERRLPVVPFKRSHQVARMQVATCLPCYQIIFHSRKDFRPSMSPYEVMSNVSGVTEAMP